MKPTCDFNRIYLDNLVSDKKKEREKVEINITYKDIKDCEERLHPENFIFFL